jgi:hypothetical protein
MGVLSKYKEKREVSVTLTKHATSLLAAGASSVLGDGKQPKGSVEREKEEDEGNRVPERANQHEEGEYSPLFPTLIYGYVWVEGRTPNK